MSRRRLADLLLRLDNDRIMPLYLRLVHDSASAAPLSDDDVQRLATCVAHALDYLREKARCISTEPPPSAPSGGNATCALCASDGASYASSMIARVDSDGQIVGLCDEAAMCEEHIVTALIIAAEQASNAMGDGDGDGGDERNGDGEDGSEGAYNAYVEREELRLSLALCDWDEWLSVTIEPNAALGDEQLVAHCLHDMIRYGLDYGFQMREFDNRVRHLRLSERLALSGVYCCNACRTILVPHVTGHWRCAHCHDYDLCTRCRDDAARAQHPADHCFVHVASFAAQQEAHAAHRGARVDLRAVPGQAA